MARYKYFDKSQGLFMTVNLNDQLIPGSFEHTLNYLIDRLDLGAFDAAFRNDKKGAPCLFPQRHAQNNLLLLLPGNYHQPSNRIRL
jgi:hypothetical protein